MDIKSKIDELKQEYKHMKVAIIEDRRYENGDRPVRWYHVIEEMIKSVYWYWKVKRCNHEYEVKEYANPESGSIYATCKKCGYQHHKTLY
jgi:hypothetical protein